MAKNLKKSKKNFGGGAPNSTIADLTDVRNGFWDRFFRAGLGRTVADSGFVIELFAAFGIMFLSSFVFRHASRPRRTVRSLYKLIGFLVPPQKKLSPISTSKIRHVQSVVGVDDDGDGD